METTWDLIEFAAGIVSGFLIGTWFVWKMIRKGWL